jgi:acyl-coenzyme A thioesterase PaaI-like protein
MMSLFFKYPWAAKFLLNIWAPFLLTGIRVAEISADYRYAKVELVLRPWNKNAVGVHFGGSLFAMADPFYMLLLMAHLRTEYVVWDKSSDIDFIKPGKGVVTAEFLLTDGLLEEIYQKTARGEKYLPTLPVYLKDEQGDVVAKINKTMYIRKKQPKAN